MAHAIDDVLAWVTACNCEAPDRDGLVILLDRLPLERVKIDTLRDAIAMLLRDLGPEDLADAQQWARNELQLIAVAKAEEAAAAN